MLSLFRTVKDRLQKPVFFENLVRRIHKTNSLAIEHKKKHFAAIPSPDEGVQGEKSVDVDSVINLKGNVFPDENSENILFDGVPFKNLPICNIRVSKNNTVVSVTNDDGTVKLLRSCGMEGFKNARKGTNIAAQATAISISMKAIDKGFKTVRVRVQGLGPGRLAAVKGLQMGGLEIVSITDATRVSWNPPRPRKARRI